MKRIVSLLVVSVMLLTGTTYASAAEIQNNEPVLLGSYVVNEYDALVETKQSLQDSTIESNSIENELLSRAQLSNEILKTRYNYTEEEIAILKAYDGSPIEENPQLRGLFADLYGFIYNMGYDDHGVTIRFSWDWDGYPAVYGSDNVTCAWVGVNSNNGPHALRFNAAKSSFHVDYYDINRDVYTDRLEYEIDDANVDSDVSVNFDMVKNNSSTEQTWAKKGYMDVVLEEPIQTNDLQYSTVVFGYGHQTLVFSAGFSASISGISVSITPQFGTEAMYNGSISIWTNGHTEWNGDAA